MNVEEVVHEQTHQWYGVSAAPGRPQDTCLAECFATYAMWMWDEAKGGVDLDARYSRTVDANTGNTGFWQALYSPTQAPGINVYTKGPLALHALRRQIGDAAFDSLLRQWPREHRDAYVEWPQFEALAERISGQDLTGFFQAWFHGSTVPAAQYLWPGTLKP
jgi:aminopeptidase N